MSKTIAALYDHINDAHDVVFNLSNSTYFTTDDINVISQDTDSRYSRYIKEMKIDEKVVTATEAGAGAGATAGTLVGALAGLLVGTSVILIPGLGAILALGPVGATLAGAGAGALLGGMTGALVGMGIDDSDARLYTEAVRRGATLVLLRSPDAYVDKAVEIMERNNPVDIEQRSQDWRAHGWNDNTVVEKIAARDDIGRAVPASSFKELSQVEGSLNQQQSDVHQRDTAPMYAAGTQQSSAIPRRSVRTYNYLLTAVPAPLEEDFRRHLREHPPVAGVAPRYEDYKDAYALGAWLGRYEKMQWEQLQAQAHKLWADQHDERGETWDEVKDRVQYAWHKAKAGVYQTTL
jgi:uncharacterized membrane protein